MIKVKKLNKVIDDKFILKDINFTIEKGEVIALVGPNGAGKSTLIDCLFGNKLITGGEIEGKYIIENHVKTSVLYQQTAFTPNMKVYQIINLFQNLYPDALTLDEILEITHFDYSTLEKEANKLSGGQKRIFDIALTLIGKPELIFMDEATVGMDTNTRKRFYQLINTLKKQGKTVFFITHYIEEVESLSDRILVLNEGNIIRDTTPQLLKEESQRKQILVSNKYKYILEKLPFIEYQLTKKSYFIINTNEVNKLVQLLIEQEIDFQSIEIRNVSLLDSIFKAIEEERYESA